MILTKNDMLIRLGVEPNIIEVTARISLKAKHISIRITPTKIVELILPKRADFNKAYQFLITKELWIRNKLQKVKYIPPVIKEIKAISIFGQEHQLIFNDLNISEPIKILNGQILISSVIAANKIDSLIAFHLKKTMKMIVEQYASLKATELNVKYQRISIRDTTSRWGSCSTSGNLSFSWRLILAPKYVLEYVVVHELCHLVEMNHSHQFWKLVDNIYPEHQLARTWLKKHGKTLHQLFTSNN